MAFLTKNLGIKIYFFTKRWQPFFFKNIHEKSLFFLASSQLKFIKILKNPAELDYFYKYLKNLSVNKVIKFSNSKLKFWLFHIKNSNINKGIFAPSVNAILRKIISVLK